MPKMPNMNQLMKMAQDMSRKMEEQMDAIEVEGNAGGGMVKVTMNGHKNVLSTEIASEVVDPDDLEMLQDLVTAAINDAITKVDEHLKENLSGMPGGLGMPGGFPFPGM
jgi:DNA-binding YbaB/EbfC family protein